MRRRMWPQPGEDGGPRKVWMFPIRPLPDNDVKKMAMFVFKDMEDFKTRGKDVDEQYMKMIIAKKKSGRKSAYVPPVIPKPDPKPPVVIPDDIVGKQVRHKAFGIGTITVIEGNSIAVDLDKVGLKKMGFEFARKRRCLNSFDEIRFISEIEKKIKESRTEAKVKWG